MRGEFELRKREAPAVPYERDWQLQTVSCDLCGSRKQRPIMQKAGRVRAQMFTIVRCSDCRFVFVNPRISDAHIVKLYDDAYYRGDGFDPGITYDSVELEPSARKSLAEIVQSVEEAAGGSLHGRLTLDVGCGAGHLVAAMRDQGADAYGQDFSITAQALADRLGVRLLSDSIEDLESQTRRFDVITAIEVIEHVPYPTAFVKSLVRLLNPGAILFLGTGNWNAIRFLPGTPYIMPEGHLAYFTPASMNRLFLNAGLVDRSRALNGTWIGCRVLSRVGLSRSPIARALSAFAQRITPAIGPFPIALSGER